MKFRHSDVASFSLYYSHRKQKKKISFSFKGDQKAIQINPESTSTLQGLYQHNKWSMPLLWHEERPLPLHQKSCWPTPVLAGSLSWNELWCHLLKYHKESQPSHILPRWQIMFTLEGLLRHGLCQAKAKLKFMQMQLTLWLTKRQSTARAPP